MVKFAIDWVAQQEGVKPTQNRRAALPRARHQRKAVGPAPVRPGAQVPSDLDIATSGGVSLPGRKKTAGRHDFLRPKASMLHRPRLRLRQAHSNQRGTELITL